MIRDYATEEEIQSPKMEPEAESLNTSESLENSSVPDDVTADPAAEEVVADQVGTPTSFEKERTVH